MKFTTCPLALPKRLCSGVQVEAVATKLDDLLKQLLPGVSARSAEELNPPSSDSLATSCVRVEGLLSDPEVTVSITNTLNAHYEQVRSLRVGLCSGCHQAMLAYLFHGC